MLSVSPRNLIGKHEGYMPLNKETSSHRKKILFSYFSSLASVTPLHFAHQCSKNIIPFLRFQLLLSSIDDDTNTLKMATMKAGF